MTTPTPVARKKPVAVSGAASGPRAFGAPAVKTALVVGTALTLINHPEVVGLVANTDLVLPLLLNYLVPFLVAGYSRHRLLRRLQGDGDPLP